VVGRAAFAFERDFLAAIGLFLVFGRVIGTAQLLILQCWLKSLLSVPPG
jgi:hypothetical protein